VSRIHPDDSSGKFGYPRHYDFGSERRVSATEKDIVDFLAKQATAAWDADPEHPQPYLLSFAGPDFKEAQIDYHTALAGERMKAFVERTEGENSYRVVKHPTQPAKIGLTPWGMSYEFEAPDLSTRRPRDRVKPGSERGSLLIEFLGALETLTDSDLDEIIIPTRILVKLVRKR
jgi:hypothetical protein